MFTLCFFLFLFRFWWNIRKKKLLVWEKNLSFWINVCRVRNGVAMLWICVVFCIQLYYSEGEWKCTCIGDICCYSYIVMDFCYERVLIWSSLLVIISEREEMVIWARKKTGDPVIRINSIAEANEFLQTHAMYAVGLFDKFEVCGWTLCKWNYNLLVITTIESHIWTTNSCVL